MLTDDKLWRETLEEAAYEKGYQIGGGNVMRTYFFFVLPIMLGTGTILAIVGVLLKPDSDIDWLNNGGAESNEKKLNGGNEDDQEPLMQDDEER